MGSIGWNMDDWGAGVDAYEACEVRGVGFTTAPE